MGATSRTGSRLGAFTRRLLLGRGGTARSTTRRRPPPGARSRSRCCAKIAAIRGDRRHFYRGARAAERVRHPTWWTVRRSAGRHGTPFIVQEFLRRGSQPLRDAVRRRAVGGARSPHHDPVIEAVACAHQRSVVHRDSAGERLPSKSVTSSSQVLGLRHLARIQELRGAAHDGGRSIGTPAYMSPERILLWRLSDVGAHRRLSPARSAGSLAACRTRPDPATGALRRDRRSRRPPPRSGRARRPRSRSARSSIAACATTRWGATRGAVELQDVKQTVASDPDLAEAPHMRPEPDFVDRPRAHTTGPGRRIRACHRCTGRNVVVSTGTPTSPSSSRLPAARREEDATDQPRRAARCLSCRHDRQLRGRAGGAARRPEHA